MAIIGGSPLLWPARTGETSCALLEVPSSVELFIAYGTKLSCTAVQKHCVYFHSCYREKVTLCNVQKLAIIGDCTLGWSCVLNCLTFMLSSLPCFYALC